VAVPPSQPRRSDNFPDTGGGLGFDPCRRFCGLVGLAADNAVDVVVDEVQEQQRR
jgi:hypothetical protein